MPPRTTSGFEMSIYNVLSIGHGGPKGIWFREGTHLPQLHPESILSTDSLHEDVTSLLDLIKYPLYIICAINAGYICIMLCEAEHYTRDIALWRSHSAISNIYTASSRRRVRYIWYTLEFIAYKPQCLWVKRLGYSAQFDKLANKNKLYSSIREVRG